MMLISWTLALEYNDAARKGTDMILFLYAHPFSRLFEFTIGMCAALAWMRWARLVQVGRGAGTVIELLAFALVIYAMSRNGAETVDTPISMWRYASADIAIPAALLICVMASNLGWVASALSI